jgi:hypothetical protein
MFSVWEYCHVDPVLVEEFNDMQNEVNGWWTTDESVAAASSSSSSNTARAKGIDPSGEEESGQEKEQQKQGGMQALLSETNESCRTALQLLDGGLLLVQDIKGAYFDVTGRTNTLIHKCEVLLDQQV